MQLICYRFLLFSFVSRETSAFFSKKTLFQRILSQYLVFCQKNEFYRRKICKNARCTFAQVIFCSNLRLLSLFSGYRQKLCLCARSVCSQKIHQKIIFCEYPPVNLAILSYLTFSASFQHFFLLKMLKSQSLLLFFLSICVKFAFFYSQKQQCMNILFLIY